MHPHEYGLIKARYSVNETLEVLSTSRATLYGRLVADGSLAPVKEGKRTFFLACDLAGYLDRLRSAAASRGTLEAPKAA
jgi:hypothetical protein